MPEFETVATGHAYETESDAPEMPQLRLAEGASADTIDWPNLGYADAYAESFEIFDRLQQEGTIPAGVRMQVQYPTPLASMAGTVVPEDMQAVAASYERALFADLDDLLGRLPHDRVAVQWDVAVEFGVLEGAFGLTLPLEHVAPGLIRALDQVPADVPAGHAPLLRRLRPPALHAARVAADAGRRRQRRRVGRVAAAQLGLVHRAPGARPTRATSHR